ncbi:FimD/PapC C-terminal domain-containing protein [Escherichia coli]
MAVLRLQDGSYPPFGAEVKNDNAQNVGLVDDDGNVYLAGVKPGDRSFHGRRGPLRYSSA